MSGPNKKLKLLLFGCVSEQILPFANKVKALHKSKAGPFHVAFCVGSFHVPKEGTAEHDALKALPIPVYVQDALRPVSSTSDSTDNKQKKEEEEEEEEEEDIHTIIEPNLKAFPTTVSNVYNISVPSHPHVNLVVASCHRSLRMDDSEGVQPLMDKIAHVAYVGCDLLLTSHWPQGMEGLGDAGVAHQTRLSATYDVAEVALRARARYQVVPSHTKINTFWQSPPFFHLASTTSTQTPQHTGRLLALGAVSAEKKVPKENKFVHALGLVPLHSMDVQELQQSLGQGVAPCPFTDASYSKDSNSNNSTTANVNGSGSSITTQSNVGLSEAHARRLLAEGAQGQPQRWNLPKNRKRSNHSQDKDENDDEPEEVDPNNTTLFVHGLHKDVSGQLQQASNITLLQAFQPYGVQKVRRPPNATTTSFAFLEFDTHQQAKDCLETLGGETTVAGVHVTLKWGTHTRKHHQQQHKRPRLTEEEAKDSSRLYYRLPRHVSPDDWDTTSEHVRQWMEDTLESALSEEGNRITAAEEPALQVELQHMEGNVYGFLDFASHAAASMAMATLTGNTNGGTVERPDDEKDDGDDEVPKEEESGASEKSAKENEVVLPADNDVDAKASVKEEKTGEESKTESMNTDDDKTSNGETTEKEKAVSSGKWKKTWGLSLHWANAKREKSDMNHSMIQDADCDFTFTRQHFPADGRQDCWFCLASEGCEKHLISGVYQQCYAAMPKGAIHKGHVLLIPVAHSSEGAFMNKSVSREIQDLQKALRRHAQDEYSMDLLVFERAIQTRGGYHTHVQCVPVPKGLGVKLETTLRAQAKANKMELREIQSPDLDISTLLRQNEDSEDGGYFYAEVPTPGRPLEFKRFLYQLRSQDQESNSRRPVVPLQFGREVIAAVLGKSKLAHWKSCQVDKEEETKMAAELRQSFEKYYEVDN